MTGERFLGRWLRLKRSIESAEAADPLPPVEALPQPPAPAMPRAVEGAAPPAADRVSPAIEPAPLPDVASLPLDSEYAGFMRADVAPGLRSSALRQLFKDPHFNRMDGLDIYIDDYSRPDPIPLAFLKQMHQSRVLRLFDDEPEAPHAAASPTADPDPARATAPAATDEGTAEPDFAQSPDGQHPGAVGGPGVPPANAPGQDVDRVAGLPDPTPERHG